MESIIELNKRISKDNVIIVSPSLEMIGTSPWTEAATLIATSKGYAILDRAESAIVRSKNLEFAWPLVVCKSNHKRYERKMQLKTHSSSATKQEVMKRDNWICRYCGDPASTVDHVIPKSRLPKGTANTWGNMVAACKTCNHSKADRTPEEAGMKTPIVKDGYVVRDGEKYKSELQDLLYTALVEMSK